MKKRVCPVDRACKTVEDREALLIHLYEAHTRPKDAAEDRWKTVERTESVLPPVPGATPPEIGGSPWP